MNSCRKLIQRCFKSEGVPVDNRGNKGGKSTIRLEMRDNIFSYNPTISHYRREHAPNVLYLPSDLTLIGMYQAWEEERIEQGKDKGSYSLYCEVAKENKIHFTKLGHEECESCIGFEIHENETNHSRGNLDKEDKIDCNVCEVWSKHHKRALMARELYSKDKTSDGLVVSVDLQKVIQLPRMETLKRVMFAKRIVAMNETFAPVGGKGLIFAMVWNETISGRHQEDILSAFHMFFVKNGHHNNIKLWLDNCTSQNKNWQFFVHLILLVNSKLISSSVLELWFFEPGHTFMSADSFHHQVEKELKNAKKVYNYDDFVACVKRANAHNPPQVVDMNYSDFFKHGMTVSNYQLNKITPRPYIAEMKKIRFERGSFDFHFAYELDSDYKSINLFNKKQLQELKSNKFDILSKMKYRTEPIGIEKEKKDSIVKNLVPLMPALKGEYWSEIPLMKTPVKITN